MNDSKDSSYQVWLEEEVDMKLEWQKKVRIWIFSFSKCDAKTNFEQSEIMI